MLSNSHHVSVDCVLANVCLVSRQCPLLQRDRMSCAVSRCRTTSRRPRRRRVDGRLATAPAPVPCLHSPRTWSAPCPGTALRRRFGRGPSDGRLQCRRRSCCPCQACKIALVTLVPAATAHLAWWTTVVVMVVLMVVMLVGMIIVVLVGGVMMDSLRRRRWAQTAIVTLWPRKRRYNGFASPS